MQNDSNTSQEDLSIINSTSSEKDGSKTESSKSAITDNKPDKEWLIPIKANDRHTWNTRRTHEIDIAGWKASTEGVCGVIAACGVTP